MRPVTESGILSWSSRVLTAIELERLREPVREIRVPPKTIITPSARDWIRSHGTVVVEIALNAEMPTGSWCIASERPFPTVDTAIAGLTREGLTFASWPGANGESSAQWVRWLAEHLAGETSGGAIVFCHDAALAVCVANKAAAIRAATVANTSQVKTAFQSFGANWFAIAMPGPTLFEIRQMLRTIAAAKPDCPPNVAEIFTELERRG